MSAKTLARLMAFGGAIAFSLATPATTLAQSGNNGGMYGSVQWLLLAPKINSDGFRKVFYDGVDFDTVLVAGSFEDNLESGVRFVFGNETCCGFGGRVRYFRYDQDITYTGLWDGGAPNYFQAESSIDVNALDLELTQRLNCCDWNLVLGAGLRHGSVDIMQPPGFFDFLSSPPLLNPGLTGVEFDGVGPTFSIGANRCLGYGLSVVGQARTSLLFGDIDVTHAFRSFNSTIEDEFVQAWEFQFGLNYQTRVNGHNVTAGIFWEAQRWDSDSDFLGDLALHGLGFSGGVTF